MGSIESEYFIYEWAPIQQGLPFRFYDPGYVGIGQPSSQAGNGGHGMKDITHGPQSNDKNALAPRHYSVCERGRPGLDSVAGLPIFHRCIEGQASALGKHPGRWLLAQLLQTKQLINYVSIKLNLLISYKSETYISEIKLSQTTRATCTNRK